MDTKKQKKEGNRDFSSSRGTVQEGRLKRDHHLEFFFYLRFLEDAARFLDEEAARFLGAAFFLGDGATLLLAAEEETDVARAAPAAAAPTEHERMTPVSRSCQYW